MKDRENGALKKRVATLLNYQAENESLKEGISKHVENEKELKESAKKADISSEQLHNKLSEQEAQAKLYEEQINLGNLHLETQSNKIAALEAQLEKERQKSCQLKKDKLQIKVESEALNTMRKSLTLKNVQLQDENTQNLIKIKQQEENIRNLRMNCVPMDSEGSRVSSQGHENFRKHLLNHQKMKDKYRKGSQLTEAKQMVSKLISLTTDQEILNLAKKELVQFEVQLESYLSAVERNIQQIKSTGSEVNPMILPQEPNLSDEFLRIYSDEIDKHPSSSTRQYNFVEKMCDTRISLLNTSTSQVYQVRENPAITTHNAHKSSINVEKVFSKPRAVPSHIAAQCPPDELEDLECVICLQNMNSSEETLKCGNCKRRTHFDCASQWLDVKSECPACRERLLNPTEYPPLN